MKDVQRFFKSRHRGQYKIYNLCSERTYAASKMSSAAGGGGQAAHFPFEDHNAPALSQLMDICELTTCWTGGQRCLGSLGIFCR
jgi:phosphatidylinositol-3,4,5-trisphosphate 3-phosphatase/dual-specificity protein phosphatase PTEN